MMRTFLITGCSRGIGLAIARQLVQLNYQVIGIARNKPEDFDGIFYQADLSSANETMEILNQIKNNHLVSGVINNLGHAKPQLLEELSLDSFFEVMDLNLRPAIQAAQTFMPSMRKHGWGRIVNISSRAMLGKVGRSSYSAAKAGIVSLTRTWALELAETGITVNAVAPGPVETEGFVKNYPHNSMERQRLIETIPMRRVGSAEEIAYAVGFFLDSKASFITGQTLFVDGGGSIGISQL